MNLLVNHGIQLELLSALGGLEPNDDVRDCLPVSSKGVFSLFGGEFCDFTFVDFLDFFDAKACGMRVSPCPFFLGLSLPVDAFLCLCPFPDK